MSHIESAVKPILEEMGLFKGKNVSVKDAFLKYLDRFPKGVGPLGLFMKLVEHELDVDVKEIRDGDKEDFMFVYNQRAARRNTFFNFDPRTQQI